MLRSEFIAVSVFKHERNETLKKAPFTMKHRVLLDAGEGLWRRRTEAQLLDVLGIDKWPSFIS